MLKLHTYFQSDKRIRRGLRQSMLLLYLTLRILCECIFEYFLLENDY